MFQVCNDDFKGVQNVADFCPGLVDDCCLCVGQNFNGVHEACLAQGFGDVDPVVSVKLLNEFHHLVFH